MTLIDWIALGVMLLGVILLIVERCMRRGFGLPGLAGLLFCAAGLRCLPIPGGQAAAAFTIIAVIVAAAFGFTLYSASKDGSQGLN